MLAFCSFDGVSSKDQVNHINAIKTDNYINKPFYGEENDPLIYFKSNLEWTDNSYNQIHSFLHHCRPCNLTKEQYLEIYNMAKQGYSDEYIANKYNLSKNYIYVIRSGKSGAAKLLLEQNNLEPIVAYRRNK